MVYEEISSVKEDSEYWKDYVEFYEKYWDAPATPRSSWWGIEYEEFRNSLSAQLNIDKKHIRDCFFTKDTDGNYYICPIGTTVNLNIMSCENFIPFEWFLLFESTEKSYFYTHTGFGAVHHDAIYYSSDLESSLKRAADSLSILSGRMSDDQDGLNEFPGLSKLSFVGEGLSNTIEWLGGFAGMGVVMLNYGEICSFIEPDSMKNEDSVGEIRQILESIKKGDFKTADNSLKLLIYKWSDIESKAAGKTESYSLQ